MNNVTLATSAASFSMQGGLLSGGSCYHDAGQYGSVVIADMDVEAGETIASERASFITGDVIRVDGGLSIR